MKKFFTPYLIIFSLLLLLPLLSFAQEPISSPKDADKGAAMHNDEGISHYSKGHWKVAAKHFKEAIEVDSKFAVGYYNLALALHKAGTHREASKYFQKAYDLAPDNKEIANSKVLKKHIGK